MPLKVWIRRLIARLVDRFIAKIKSEKDASKLRNMKEEVTNYRNTIFEFLTGFKLSETSEVKSDEILQEFNKNGKTLDSYIDEKILYLSTTPRPQVVPNIPDHNSYTDLGDSDENERQILIGQFSDKILHRIQAAKSEPELDAIKKEVDNFTSVIIVFLTGFKNSPDGNDVPKGPIGDQYTKLRMKIMQEFKKNGKVLPNYIEEKRLSFNPGNTEMSAYMGPRGGGKRKSSRNLKNKKFRKTLRKYNRKRR